jgi:hypothetical protein
MCHRHKERIGRATRLLALEKARIERESFSEVTPDIIPRAEILRLATRDNAPYPMIRALLK